MLSARVTVFDFLLVVCDIAANHQEQMPMEESGNMVGWDMYILQYIGIDNVYCMCTALLAVKVYMLGTRYILSVDLLRKPWINALRSKSEVRSDNPWMVLSTAQTFAQTILGCCIV